MLTITATDLPRLMGCNGSLLMKGLEKPVIESDNTVKDEGNAADWLVSEVHKGEHIAEEFVDRKAPNGHYIDAVMVEHLEEYLDNVLSNKIYDERFSFIEHNTSHGCVDWQINGRADSVFYDAVENKLFIDDLKYGWKIVEPEMNWTLISHALGFWFQNPGMKLASITFSIYQPRPYHAEGRVRSWTIDGEKLIELYNQINQTLSNPSNILQTGEHCYKCPALLAGACPAANKAKYNAIEASEQAFVDTIDNDTLSFQLDHLKRTREVLKQVEDAYKELAIHRVKKGRPVKNYSIETELANTSWKKHATVDMIAAMSGKDVSNKALITPNQAKKAGVSEELVAVLTERRKKGLKLVRVDANTKAQRYFKPPTEEKESKS